MMRLLAVLVLLLGLVAGCVHRDPVNPFVAPVEPEALP